MAKLDTILIKDLSGDQIVVNLANSQNKKKNVSFRIDSMPPSPKSNKLLDIDNFSFQTDEEDMNLKFDENE